MGIITTGIISFTLITVDFGWAHLHPDIWLNALLSALSPLQKFAFDQPDIAILNFPFSWLPTFIVTIVLFGYLVSIRQLLRNN